MTVDNSTQKQLDLVKNIDDTNNLLNGTIKNLRSISDSNPGPIEKEKLHEQIVRLVDFLMLLKTHIGTVLIHYVDRAGVEEQAPPDFPDFKDLPMDQAINWFRSRDGGDWIMSHVGFIRLACSIVRDLTDPTNAENYRAGETYFFKK